MKLTIGSPFGNLCPFSRIQREEGELSALLITSMQFNKFPEACEPQDSVFSTWTLVMLTMIMVRGSQDRRQETSDLCFIVDTLAGCEGWVGGGGLEEEGAWLEDYGSNRHQK